MRFNVHAYLVAVIVYAVIERVAVDSLRALRWKPTHNAASHFPGHAFFIHGLAQDALSDKAASRG